MNMSPPPSLFKTWTFWDFWEDCPLSKGSLAYNRGHQTKFKNQTAALVIQKQSLTKRKQKRAGDPGQKEQKMRR